MLTLIHSPLRCIRSTPVSAILPDGRLALVALWSFPLLLSRHPRMTPTPTKMTMIRMEMLALLVLRDVYLILLPFVTCDKKGK